MVGATLWAVQYALITVVAVQLLLPGLGKKKAQLHVMPSDGGEPTRAPACYAPPRACRTSSR